MRIVRLTPGDAPLYRALMLEAYRLHPDLFTSSVPESEARPLAWWESRMAEGPDARELVLGAFEGSVLAGVVGLTFDIREKANHKARLFGMFVAREFRGQGLGERLVRAILEQARNSPGTKLVQLTVTHGNMGAQTLYERCGFVSFGLEPYAVAVGPAFVSKVHMWCDLGVSQGQTATS